MQRMRRVVEGARVLGLRLAPIMLLSCVALVSCPNAIAQSARTYEVVSPASKNGADVESDGIARVSAAGDRVSYVSFGNFAGGGASGSLYNQMFSVRGPSGWATRGINPPLTPDESDTPREYPFIAFSDDLAQGVAWINQAKPPLGGPRTGRMFLWNSGSGVFAPIVVPYTTVSSDGESWFVGASRDFEHIVFDTDRALTADAPLAGDGIDQSYLYQSVGGELRLLGVSPPVDSNGAATGVGLGRGRRGVFSNPYPGDNAISADGSHFFFSTYISDVLDSRRALYAHVDEGSSRTTVRVDESERTDCAGDPTCGGDGTPDPMPDPIERASFFQMASADGSKAFFTSAERLTTDAVTDGQNPDLYRWEANAPVGERLTDLTTGDPEGGGVGGGYLEDPVPGAVIGGNDEGTVLYFVGTRNIGRRGCRRATESLRMAGGGRGRLHRHAR